MATLLIAGGLIGLALFLPPISLPERLLALSYTPLSTDAPAIALDERLTVALPADHATSDFAIKLESSQPDRLASALQQLPAHLNAIEAPQLLDTRGTAPAALHIDLSLPADAPPHVALYGWDGETWRFIPSQPSERGLQGRADFLPLALGGFAQVESAPLVLISQEVRQDLDPAIAAIADILSPAGLRPTADGGLIGSLAPGGSANADYLFMPLIRNFVDPAAIDSATVAALLADPTLRAAHIRHLSDVASFNEFAGLFIDYRGLLVELRAAFAGFVLALADEFSAQGLRLGLVIPASGDPDAAYDWAAVGAAADYVQLRPLDEPRAYAELDSLLSQLTASIPRHKLLLGISVRPAREVAGKLRPVGWHDAFAGLGDLVLESADTRRDGSLAPGAVFHAALDGYRARFNYDTQSGVTALDYVDDTAAISSRIWLTDAATLRHHFARIETRAIGGIAFDDLHAVPNGKSLLRSIRDYVAGRTSVVAPSQFSARWTIAGEDGLVDEVVSRPDADLVATLDAPDGHYAINWSLVDELGNASARGGAVIPLFRATATPSPSPTPIPTPAPIVSAPIVTTNPAPIVSAPAPVGNIHVELGGQVTSVSSSRAINAMRQAGMTWMKIQVKYSRGSPPDMHSKIQEVHGNGFKILISAVGYPDELSQGGAGYVSDFAHWLGRVASWGADAIEVWNEPNLDREWPQGQISGTAYANMLRSAYQQIKNANPNVLVISAAPAPTGAAIPGRVVPDNTWLREVVAAGGVEYMDCVGVHYNEGIVPPSQETGDPRGDNYYTRYFYSGMLVGYLSIIPDRPLCFTEMGYVTSQGYGSLPSGFAWGAKTTVQQQADWLAQAAIIASNSGAVRLFIVWNIDFTRYDSDPQGGYAIIRPDGSCPACHTLAAAR
ncbi:MAG: hypothetical protein OXE46_11305 [Chloroflexi bacterium]|nr:hypothetical protein [Chloroflexota bacterium]